MSVIERVDSRGGVDGSLRAAVVVAGQRWADGQRELVRLVRELDASGEWAADGVPSCAHWIAGALDVELCTAREWLRIGRALIELDVVGRAFADGRLSYSKVRALTRVATVENQVELCALAEQTPASRLAPAVAAWLSRHETPAQTEARQHQARSFSSRIDIDGMIVGSYRLPPAEGVKISAPVDEIVWQRRPGDRGRGADASADAPGAAAPMRWPTIAQQRADALIAVVSGSGSPVATEIVMHVRADGCALDDGTPIPGSVIERIAPASFLRALIHDAEARPINASGRQRHPTARQRRVVRERDRVCVDCGSTEFLQYDHEPDYNESRHTTVDETKLRCWICHRLRHARARLQS
jgi:hypothetical protein